MIDRRNLLRTIACVFLLCFSHQTLKAQPDRRPNVILILTDDQGYGDLSCLGNPILKTPALDRLYEESVRFSNMHVMPFCTPTRASLMTGHCATRTGAYRTSSGRTMMHTDEVTMAEVFRKNGYATGMFGKWHLGDNYPHRPQDRGFQTTLWHRCGGVGQASDYWGNDYFDDAYEFNGEFKKFEGYCTDIWFKGALDFIEDNARKKQPFFAYIPTNAPHGPYLVPEKYAKPYKQVATWNNGMAANFFGMIANIDENVALLRRKLKEWGIEDNTILIFMTDNGTACGVDMGLDALPAEGMGYNAGMRGKKSSIFDGGHRVPCFFYWPAGGIVGGRDIPQLAAGYDVLPTLVELCDLDDPHIDFDGCSLVPLLRGEGDWPQRELVLQFQGGAYFRYVPEMWSDSLVMTERWRLLGGERLFDIVNDPTQSNNVADQHPGVVQKLRKRYEQWWADVSPRIKEPVRIHVANPAENPVTLCSQDWYMPQGNPPWNFGEIRRLPKVTGPWMIYVEKSGKYKVTLCQWPLEAAKPIVAETARVKVAGVEEDAPVNEGAISVSFEMELPAGNTTVETFLATREGQIGGAYFTYIEYMGR